MPRGEEEMCDGVNVDNFTNEKYWIGYSTASAQKLISAAGSFTYKF